MFIHQPSGLFLFVLPLLLAGCNRPFVGDWTGYLGFDRGGALTFDLQIEPGLRTVGGTGIVECQGVAAEGVVEVPLHDVVGALGVYLYGIDPDVDWYLHLRGDPEDGVWEGEGSFSWSPEADFVGEAFPSDCTGGGEFAAARD